jgi:hypothetical protein
MAAIQWPNRSISGEEQTMRIKTLLVLALLVILLGLTLYNFNFPTARATPYTALTFTPSAAGIDSLATSGGYLYAGDDGSPSFKIHKINLATFLEEDTLTLNSAGCFSLIVSGDYLYAGSSHILYKIDLTTFTQTANITSLSGYPYNVQSLGVDGSYLYACVGGQGPVYPITNSTLHKIDLFTFTPTSNIVVNGTYSYGMVIDGDMMYLSHEDEIINRVNLTTFTVKDELDLPTRGVSVPNQSSYNMIKNDGSLYIGGYTVIGDLWGSTGEYTILFKINASDLSYTYLNISDALGYSGSWLAITGLTVIGNNLYLGYDGDYSNMIDYVDLPTFSAHAFCTFPSTIYSDFGCNALTVGSDGYFGYFLDEGQVIKITSPTSYTINVNSTSNPEVNAAFSINGTGYITPSNITLSNGNYQLETNLSILFGGGFYYFDHWLVNSTVSYLPSLALDLTGNTTVTIYYDVSLPDDTVLESSAIGQTWYFRDYLHTVNNNTALNLLPYQGLTSRSTSSLSNSIVNASWGFRVWQVFSTSLKSELTDGVPVAIVSRDSDGSGYQNGTWTFGGTTFNIGFDAIEVGLYSRLDGGNWILNEIFITPRLLMKSISAGTWTFQLWTNYTAGSTNATACWGSPSFNSFITFITMTSPNDFEIMNSDLQNGQIFSFIVWPYVARVGVGFYGLVVLLICVSLYNKYKSVTIILFLFVLFGSSGGMLGVLVPSTGLAWLWIIFLLALAGLIYKAFK